MERVEKIIRKEIIMNNFNLNFEGYWRDCNKGGLPTYSGIYFVYRCRYNEQNDTVTLIDIIYIGQAENIHDRHINHEKEELFKNQLLPGEEICISCAPVESNLDVVENALIFAQKPILNEKGKDRFLYGEVHLSLNGACSGVKYTDFTIK